MIDSISPLANAGAGNYSYTAGYSCPRCGAWVGGSTSTPHVCAGYISPPPTPPAAIATDHGFRYAAALERIAAALERIADALATKEPNR